MLHPKRAVEISISDAKTEQEMAIKITEGFQSTPVVIIKGYALSTEVEDGYAEIPIDTFDLLVAEYLRSRELLLEVVNGNFTPNN